MTVLRYQLVNVFVTDDIWSGNPLAVFKHEETLSDDTMCRLGQQMNLSEITFVRPSNIADAHVRIFTPSYEMPFAGHPTLGTAFTLANGRDRLTLEMKAGVIPVEIAGDQITLSANAPSYRAGPNAAQLAAALNIDAHHIIGTPRFVNTGSEQLIVPLDSAESVARCVLDLAAFERIALNDQGRSGALVWAKQGDTVIARYFWSQHGQSAEDFGTGSACANLGGWLLAENTPLPVQLNMEQGHGINRIARLSLSIKADGQIQVGGKVRQIGTGEFNI
ncbi:PhzF family phenazine biosynthesis protein [Chitinibacter bivalviorum]|uniref:PhzF family phenazine biosynthesis protein n=1 Tax=Chitinibacter bivalviorum TaxID=2739434 RepID=A0A7H9BJV0_9NEIS|nr:PhzF family phenazine biosynthesis protein [Chitinibacter bivalviorum]QLG88528.1 PhzF family phenazine biosynthesis protein [Chitinibacter bivalviorum]